MRKVTLVLMPALVLAVVAVASAQYAMPVMNGALKVKPTDAGTSKKPKNGLVKMGFTVNELSNTTLKRIDFTIPKKIRLNGKGFKHCSVAFINQNGNGGCPKKSKVGIGTATALLGPNKSRLDFTITIYVEKDKKLALYLQTSLLSIAITGKIEGQVVRIDIPERVQSPVPGLYAYITEVTAAIGKQDGIKAAVTKGSGKKKKTYYFASIIGCPTAGHAGATKGYLTPNPDPPPVPVIEDVATSNCTK